MNEFYGKKGEMDGGLSVSAWAKLIFFIYFFWINSLKIRLLRACSSQGF